MTKFVWQLATKDKYGYDRMLWVRAELDLGLLEEDILPKKKKWISDKEMLESILEDNFKPFIEANKAKWIDTYVVYYTDDTED